MSYSQNDSLRRKTLRNIASLRLLWENGGEGRTRAIAFTVNRQDSAIYAHKFTRDRKTQPAPE